MSVTPLTVRVANAPCNFGIYQPAPDHPPLDPDTMLAELTKAGYDGTDSGPIGWFGTGDLLATRLRGADLELAGGWVDMRYDDADGFAADRAGLEAALDAFTAVPVGDPRFAPRPTLACPASPERYVRPGLAYGTLRDWRGFASRVQEAADRCRDRGLEPVFHPHLGTDIETVEETERLLELTDISLCLDTGHLYLAGGDPVAALHRFAPRIRQVHLKDASMAITQRARAAGRNFDELVADGGFTRIGAGDLPPVETVRALTSVGYTGWIVIEQDAPATGTDARTLLADQRANRAALRQAGV